MDLMASAVVRSVYNIFPTCHSLHHNRGLNLELQNYIRTSLYVLTPQIVNSRELMPSKEYKCSFSLTDHMCPVFSDYWALYGVSHRTLNKYSQ